MLRSGINSLSQWGICLESSFPSTTDITTAPSQSCYSEARQNVITKYYRLLGLDQMKNCLASGFPFVFGFTVFDWAAQTGIFNLPDSTNKIIGKQAALVIGYDDITQRFKVKNSFGNNWGINGYFTIPYEYVTNLYFCGDYWTIQEMKM